MIFIAVCRVSGVTSLSGGIFVHYLVVNNIVMRYASLDREVFPDVREMKIAEASIRYAVIGPRISPTTQSTLRIRVLPRRRFEKVKSICGW
jgi:hypothetical protein